MDHIGAHRALALPSFHAFTGCDTTAPFFHKGKKLAWETWNSFPAITRPLTIMSGPNPTLSMILPYLKVIHAFINRLYGIQDDEASVDETRLFLLLHKGKEFNQMPPSSDAVHQKILRTAYQVPIAACLL